MIHIGNMLINIADYTYPAESCGQYSIRVSDPNHLGVSNALMGVTLGSNSTLSGINDSQLSILALGGQQVAVPLPGHTLDLITVILNTRRQS